MPDAVGFYTDTTVCIGCKACQVACRQWNDPPAGKGRTVSLPLLSGNSYDNTGGFSDVNWRHVKFIEKPLQDGPNRVAWLMMSDVCKHCVNAPCLEVCPTGAILRTEFDTVFINEPTCNGCRDCVSACPFGVIHMSEAQGDRHGVAQKCTFCYDRLKNNMVPACAQACPTNSIQFGKLDDLRERAKRRVAQLHAQNVKEAYLYGEDDKVLGGLNSFYLLVDKPQVYGLPPDPQLPSRNLKSSAVWSMLGAVVVALTSLISFRNRGRGDV
jgi:formate dehydrogenase iron-sulfur subunit